MTGCLFAGGPHQEKHKPFHSRQRRTKMDDPETKHMLLLAQR